MKLLALSLLSLFAACGDNNLVLCGTGTTQKDGACVAAGSGDTCGPGTHDQNGACVPDLAGDVGAPTITSITPSAAGISGGTLFVITGTNFAGPGAGTATVKFGTHDVVVVVASPTQIAGSVPIGTSITTTVTVTTQKGMATTSFKYLALLAADSRDRGYHQLYVIDPTNGVFGLIGPLTDNDATTYNIGALAFGPDGTLYGASENEVLVTIDPATAMVTVVGDLIDANPNFYRIADMKFVGSTLYGWTSGDFNGSGLVSIDTGTGTVTPIGTPPGGSGGGIVVDGSGTMYSASQGGDGVLRIVDVGSGNVTDGPTMDYFPTDIAAMALVGGHVVAATIYNSSSVGSMIEIDQTTGTTTYISELPAAEGQLSAVDALATVPDGAAIARPAPLRWVQPPPRVVQTEMAACSGEVAVHGVTVHPARHQRVSVPSPLRVYDCDGGTTQITGTGYALVGTGHHGTKLVNTTTGRTVVRRVRSID